MNPLHLWLAQGFGIGRIPFAPGTFGSILGLGWVLLLLSTRDWRWYVTGTLAGVVCAVWLCGLAEQTLRQTDPPSVVLDEVAAIPLCYLGWLVLTHSDVPFPGPESLWAPGHRLWTLAILIAFRVFDIAKPWPVRQSQKLPGGWGVTIDDVLAAIYVNLAVLLAWFMLRVDS